MEEYKSPEPKKVILGLAVITFVVFLFSLIFGTIILRDADKSKEAVNQALGSINATAVALNKQYQIEGRYSNKPQVNLIKYNPELGEFSSVEDQFNQKRLIASNGKSFFIKATAIKKDTGEQYSYSLIAGKDIPTFTVCNLDIQIYGGVCQESQWQVEPEAQLTPVVNSGEFLISAAGKLIQVANNSIKKFTVRKKIRIKKKIKIKKIAKYFYKQLSKQEMYEFRPGLEVYDKILDKSSITPTKNGKAAVIRALWTSPEGEKASYGALVKDKRIIRTRCFDNTQSLSCKKGSWDYEALNRVKTIDLEKLQE